MNEDIVRRFLGEIEAEIADLEDRLRRLRGLRDLVLRELRCDNSASSASPSGTVNLVRAAIASAGRPLTIPEVRGWLVARGQMEKGEDNKNYNNIYKSIKRHPDRFWATTGNRWGLVGPVDDVRPQA